MFQLNSKILLGILILTTVVIFVTLYPLVYKLRDCHLIPNSPPCFTSPLGTDYLGQDLLLKICKGTQMSLFISISTSLANVIVGILLGSLFALINNKLEWLTMGFTNILLSIPTLLIFMLVNAIFSGGVLSIFISIVISGWITTARLIKTHVIVTKSLDFFVLAKMFGASKLHLLIYHLLPGIFTTSIAQFSLNIPRNIFKESYISFLGLGLHPPYYSLGSILSQNEFDIFFHSLEVISPIFFVVIITLGFNLLSEGIESSLSKL